MHLFGRHFHDVEPGKIPGTITIQASARRSQLDITTWGVGSQTSVAQPVERVADLAALSAASSALWLNVTGLGDADMLRAIGEQFAIHPLVLEDIATPSQRSKVEEYEHLLFMVIRIPVLGSAHNDWFSKAQMEQTQLWGGTAGDDDPAAGFMCWLEFYYHLPGTARAGGGFD